LRARTARAAGAAARARTATTANFMSPGAQATGLGRRGLYGPGGPTRAATAEGTTKSRGLGTRASHPRLR
jgi:hypothetical protein